MAMEQKAALTKKILIGMEDKKDALSKYQGKEYPPLEKPMQQTPQLVKEKLDYNAFEEFKSRKFPRFRIVDADGKSYGYSYAHLIDWVFDPPTLLVITTSSRIFTLKGKNLGRIEQLLMEDKLKELHVFTEGKYNPPAPNKPIIESIEIIDTN